MAQSSCTSYSCYHPNPWKMKVKDFVKIELTDANIREDYPSWKKDMFDFIEMQGMEGFLDGTIHPPPQKNSAPAASTSRSRSRRRSRSSDHQGEPSGSGTDNPDFKDWKKSDMLLTKWILATLPARDVLKKKLSSFTTARDLWQQLEDIYNQKRRSDNEKMKSIICYKPLNRAAIEGNWEEAKKILEEKKEAVRARITSRSETTLIVAVRSREHKRTEFAKELLKLMEDDDILLTDDDGYNALHTSVIVGNLELAKLLVGKIPDMPNICNKYPSPPISYAALAGNREMVEYLMTVTQEYQCEDSSKLDKVRANVTGALIYGGFHDIALKLIQDYPKLACNSCSPLSTLAVRPSAFKSGTRLNFWENSIYPFIPLNLEVLINPNKGGDIESPANNIVPRSPSILGKVYAVLGKVYALLWRVAERLVPRIKHVKEKKLIHHHAKKHLEKLCSKIGDLNPAYIRPLLERSLRNAIFYGLNEVVEEILATFPDAVNFKMGEKKHTIFHLAVIHRCEKVFNLIYQVGEFKGPMMRLTDTDGNTALHLVGSLSPQQLPKVKATIATPALQMQRELQWFKEVKKLVKPYEERRNHNDKIASEVFTESHAELLKEGEGWMKDTANSCSIVAALIVTIVFAAAITVPGGNNGDNGYPILFGDLTFTIFAISDGLAFFTSTVSLLMFLSILTARFAEKDFLYSLPMRLIFGFIALFLSIISMMVAFGTAAFLVLGSKEQWVLAPVTALGCLTVILFAFLQLPLILVMIKSTYFPGIFRKQSKRLLY